MLRYTRPEDCDAYEIRKKDGSDPTCKSFVCAETPYGGKECMCSSIDNGFKDCKECLNNCSNNPTPGPTPKPTPKPVFISSHGLPRTVYIAGSVLTVLIIVGVVLLLLRK